MTSSPFFERLVALRREIARAECDGFLVPMADEYQSEYVPPSAQRIAFLSGFTGSAATIVVLKDKAAFFTDSRYTLQAQQQVSKDLFILFDVVQKSPLTWLEENCSKGQKIAYDPWLHASEAVDRLKKGLAKIEAVAVAVPHNLVDCVWPDRPLPPEGLIYAHELIYAGKSSVEKRQEIATELKKNNRAAAVITDAASVAWLLNVRGSDIANTPLPLSRAILKDDASAEWFVDRQKVTPDLSTHLGEQVTLRPPQDFSIALDRLVASGKPVLLDPKTSSWIADYVKATGGKIEWGDDPCELPKAIKNNIELEGMCAAHRRDGAALTSFLAWLSEVWQKDHLTELVAEKKLATFRQAQNNYRGPSFETISGAGAHGAIVHYRATTDSNAALQAGQLYLLDSGGQYLDGTTDVTRTVALGVPTAEMRDRFTRVLKGHIALAAIRFPEGTTGAELDVLARQYLWEQGLDYGHGTGHGVGCYLGVHEGPQGISKRNKTPLQPGMVLSNEPGYYKAGVYGIRIENLQTVIAIEGLADGAAKTLGFETLTLVPIDRSLIDVNLMTYPELAWLNAYHHRVHQTLLPMLVAQSAAWLVAATAPVKK